MEAKFRKGDQVILKSGGPSMKVKEIDEDSVRCTWFDPNNHRHEVIFEQSELELLDSYARSLKSRSMGEDFDPRQ